MSKHVWYRDDEGNVDIFRMDADYHNGPECQVCAEAFCHHCNPGIEDAECPGGDGLIILHAEIVDQTKAIEA